MEKRPKDLKSTRPYTLKWSLHLEEENCQLKNQVKKPEEELSSRWTTLVSTMTDLVASSIVQNMLNMTLISYNAVQEGSRTVVNTKVNYGDLI